MMSVCLVVLGVMGLTRLGTDLFPDVSIPVVLVTTVYKGAGPREIESQVCKPIEDAVAGISGVDMIHSYSRENVGMVVVQFTLDTNIDRAVQEVRDKVALVHTQLPKDADAAHGGPRGPLGHAHSHLRGLGASCARRSCAGSSTTSVEPALAQLEGVAEVRVTGGDMREIQVDVDLDRAKAAGRGAGADRPARRARRTSTCPPAGCSWGPPS